MKKIALYAFISLTICASAMAATTEISKKASQPINQWTFELKNMDENPLLMQIVEIDKNGKAKELLTPEDALVYLAWGKDKYGYLRTTAAEANNAFELYLWPHHFGQNPDKFKDNLEVYAISPNANRKKIVIARQNGKIRAQKGNVLKGKLTGASSTSGLSLFGNVKDSEIRKTLPRKGVNVQMPIKK